MASCPGDLGSQTTYHPNGVIDVFDLFILLDKWGTTTNEIGAVLASPFDTVDVFDLFVLLDDWNCRVGDMPAADTLEDVVTGAGLTMDDWDEFVDVMQNSEDEDEKDNYLCWMKNYLTDCTFCPPCPDTDPFK